MIDDLDERRIMIAIQQAEALTSGEIFCVISQQSDDYGLVPLAWAAGLALLVPLPFAYLTDWSAEIVYCVQLGVFLVAALLLSLPQIRIRIVPRQIRHDRAHAEAMRQFFAQGLDKTEHRTGVLIYASSEERYAEVVADAGINEKVDPGVWDAAVAALVVGMKDGRPADGFVEAIKICGELLAINFPPDALNRNELANKLMVI
jgi:putative membrane protein